MTVMMMICAEMQGIHVQKSCSLMKWTAHTHTHTHTHTHIHTHTCSLSEPVSLTINKHTKHTKKTTLFVSHTHLL